jgi:hypothetical protein
MKANELRIGNLVYFKHCDYEYNIPRKINYTLKPNLVGLEKVSVNRIEYNNIEPIPLTEEWLLKFGFDKVLNQYKKITDVSKDTSNNIPFIILFLDNQFQYDDLRFRTNLEHVHQLQNLYFALTAEELTIKNK